MAKLSKENQDKLAEIYKRITGKEWVPPKRDKLSGIETLSEIDKLMREKPNSGRE